MIGHMMNEPSPQRFVRSIDTDSLVINGNTLLLKQLNSALLMGRNQLQQSRGKVERVPPTLVQGAIPIITFREREVMQQVHMNYLPFMTEGDNHVEYSIVYVIEVSLQTDKLRDIDITVLVQRNRLPQLIGRPGGLVDMCANHATGRVHSWKSLTVEPKLQESGIRAAYDGHSFFHTCLSMQSIYVSDSLGSQRDAGGLLNRAFLRMCSRPGGGVKFFASLIMVVLVACGWEAWRYPYAADNAFEGCIKLTIPKWLHCIPPKDSDWIAPCS